MKILFTSDLHGRKPWYSWLSRQQVDLVVIAGGLIDRLGNDDLETFPTTHYLSEFRAPVALCSGNHDQPSLWFPRLEALNILCDGQSRFIGEMLVTALANNDEVNDAILHTAQKQAGQHPWLVIHHEPPYGTRVGGEEGSKRIFGQIRRFRPDYLACGHLLAQPYQGRWYCAVGPTICFNPGQPAMAMERRPNCIYLDTATRRVIWGDTCWNGRGLEHIQLD